MDLQQKAQQNGQSGNVSQAPSQNTASMAAAQIKRLEIKVTSVYLPDELKQKANAMLERLRLIARESNFILEYDNTSRYLDWVTSLPWKNQTEDILDLAHAQQVLEKNHYGLRDVKDKLLEYLSALILQRSGGDAQAVSRAPIIALVGLAGVGKTTFAYSVAETLGRKIQRIPFGGMGAAQMLRGQSRFSPEAEPGLLIKALRRARVSNPVILLDEIDRVSEYARGDIMGVLVELLDPEQNKNFTDHYIDYPFDLCNVLFVATSNNTKDISTAVLDRLEVIQMPSYADQEKIAIAKSYVLPQTLAESGLRVQDLTIQDDAWAAMVRTLGYDPGIRSLKRMVQGITRRVARLTLEGKITRGQTFVINAQNMNQFVSEW